MITPVHLLASIGTYFIINKLGIVDVNSADLLLIFSAEAIDLDHLLSKPIYHPRRNPFKTHIFHKNWPIILAFSIAFILYRPALFLGIGLLLHLLIDYCYVKMFCIKTTGKNGEIKKVS